MEIDVHSTPKLPLIWRSLDEIPPDEFVEVIDKDGHIAVAQPTYYPFEMTKQTGDETKMWGWRGTPMFYQDGQSRWDGGWMINTGMAMKPFGYVIGWRPIEK